MLAVRPPRFKLKDCDFGIFGKNDTVSTRACLEALFLRLNCRACPGNERSRFLGEIKFRRILPVVAGLILQIVTARRIIRIGGLLGAQADSPPSAVRPVFSGRLCVGGQLTWYA